MKKMFFKNVAAALVLTALSPFAYQYFTPRVVNAVTTTDQVVVTLTVDAGISITSPADSSMSQNLGVSANTAVGTTTWNVKTNNVLGYTLSVNASTSPAMQSSSSTIPDYTPSVANTPELWSVTSGTYEFGYSAFGSRVPTGTWGTDTDCSGATGQDFSTGLKYQNFATTTRQIATYSATTTTSGDDTTVCYAVQQNGSYIPSGTYTARITATAVTL